MVLLDIFVHVISENISTLDIEGESFVWYFYIQCAQCKTEHDNEIYFSYKDEYEMTKGHGTANFLMTCKNCDRTMTVKIEDKSPLSIACESGNDEGVLATFDCRGCELIKWIPKEGFRLTSSQSDKMFIDVDVNEVWCDYDENANVNCSLLEPITYRIEKKEK